MNLDLAPGEPEIIILPLHRGGKIIWVLGLDVSRLLWMLSGWTNCC